MPRLFARTQPRRRRQPVENLAASLAADVERLEKREVMTAMAAPVITSPGPVADDATPTFTWEIENLSAEDLEKSQYEWRYEVMVYDATSGQQIGQWFPARGKRADWNGENARDGRQFTLHPNHLLETDGQYQFFVRKAWTSGAAWAKHDFTIEPKAEYVPPQPSVEGVWSGTTRPAIRWAKTANTKWYEISVRDTTPGHEREVAAGRVHTHEYQLINELTPGHSYEVQVRSASNDAYGQWSDAFEFDVDASAKSVSAVPTIIGPVGAIDDTTPTLSLEFESTGWQRFEIHIYNADGGSRTHRFFRSTSKDNLEVELPELSRGVNYQLYVRAVSSSHANAEIGQWATTDFRVYGSSERPGVTVPSKQLAETTVAADYVPQITGPIGETHTSPTITWNSVPGITVYNVQIYRNGGLHLSERVTTNEFQAHGLPLGKYTVHVGSVLESGNVMWSAGHAFEVTFAYPLATPEIPGAASPAFSSDSANVAWDAVRGAARYELLAYNKQAGRQVAHETNLTGTSFSTGGWDAAKHQVFVRAINADGKAGQWSSPLEFAITARTATVAATPTLTGPNGSTLLRRPTLQWDAAARGERYELIGYDVKAGRQVMHETSLSTASYRPETLNAGNYQFFVRRIDSTGKAGSWSNALEFTVEQDQAVRALTETRVAETASAETRAAAATLTESRQINTATNLRAVDATFADFSRLSLA